MSGLLLAPAFVVLEWAAGFGILKTLTSADREWKVILTEGSPRWIRSYFRNDMRNALCAYAVCGHFLVPVAAYCDLRPGWWVPALPGLVLYEAATIYLLFAVFVRNRRRP